MTMTPTKQTPSECKHLGYWWSCEMTAETIDGKEWAQTCDYYPRCENCKHFQPKEKKDEQERNKG